MEKQKVYFELKAFEAKLSILVKQVSEGNFPNSSCWTMRRIGIYNSVSKDISNTEPIVGGMPEPFTDRHKHGKEIRMFQNLFEVEPEVASYFFFRWN